MMFDLSDRRRLWDKNFKAVAFHEPGASAARDDVVVTSHLDFGFLINLAMFGGSDRAKLTTRNIRRWDAPRKGWVSYAMVPWDAEAGKLDRDNKLLKLKTGTIAPHPTDPGRSVMTSLEINGMGGLPSWALNFMLGKAAPGVMLGLQNRYRATARKAGDVRDVRTGQQVK